MMWSCSSGAGGSCLPTHRHKSQYNHEHLRTRCKLHVKQHRNHTANQHHANYNEDYQQEPFQTCATQTWTCVRLYGKEWREVDLRRFGERRAKRKTNVELEMC